MQKFDSPLDNVRLSAPCPADWNEMNGDDRARFCNQCQLNVYNLSAMTRGEAENLLRQTEGRLCIRYFRRADGTIITESCPKGLQAIKRRVTRTATAVFSSVLAFLSGIGVYTAAFGFNSALGIRVEPVEVENLDKYVPLDEPRSLMGVTLVPTPNTSEHLGGFIPEAYQKAVEYPIVTKNKKKQRPVKIKRNRSEK